MHRGLSRSGIEQGSFANQGQPVASRDAREELKKKLGDCGVKLVNYGVCNLSQNQDDSRKIFDFAKDMGIETIVSEPPEEALEMLDKLCAEYDMKIAIHNHPSPSGAITGIQTSC